MMSAKKRISLTIALVLMLLVCMVQCQGDSQTRGKLQDIVISVSGIQYDDRGFTSFRENLQNNRKVTAFKEHFSYGTASIDFKCTESATRLWDEIPASVKGFFQVKDVDDQHVALQGAVATANSNANDEVNCYRRLQDLLLQPVQI
jgi:hypothetical protein